MFYTSWVDYLDRTSYVDNIGDMTAEQWWNETLNLRKPVYGYTLWWHAGDIDIEAIQRQREEERRLEQAVVSMAAALRFIKDGELEAVIATARARLAKNNY